MAGKSKIEWTDATWNPIRGCSVVSEGCRNCYAMQIAARFSDKGQAYEGLAYRNESGAHWTGKVRLIEEHLKDPLRWKRPRLIFVNSMSDLFHESISDEWIDRIFVVMALSPHHVFQVLTKRPERMYRYMKALNGDRILVAAFESGLLKPKAEDVEAYAGIMRGESWPLSNVWLGVSVENQTTAEKRIPLLLKTPAAVRWISAEPLLGPIDLSVGNMIGGAECYCGDFVVGDHGPYGKDPCRVCRCMAVRTPWTRDANRRIDWVVLGYESGINARPGHPDWARSLRDQCLAAGIPIFFKQWGEWDGGGVFGSECDDPCGRCVQAMSDGSLTGIDWEPGPHLIGSQTIHRVGKKAAGRLLDGREWNEYPNVVLGGA